MNIQIHSTKQSSGQAAAEAGAKAIRHAIATRGHANIIVATGASQFAMIEHLVTLPDIRWDRVTAFHLDEYVGIAITHPASFRKYLWERFQKLLPLPLKAFHYLDGETDAAGECARVGAIIRQHPIDVAFVGIGENGHLAFNDPPADFETDEPYLVVALDEDCRRQQLGEGWFASLAEVPTHAISMSIRQIMKSAEIIATVPDARKAVAVQKSLEGPIGPMVPSSILQQHPRCGIYLDTQSSALLKR